MSQRKAKALMVQGTGSHVGKSVIVAALCRIFYQDGYNVAPFKSQNMALNSYITIDGGEIGRAQATQAEAANIEPTVDMNPILLKPNTDIGAQVIVQGKLHTNMSVKQYYNYQKDAFKAIKDSYNRLSSQFDLIVIEGAGSPAEINLRKNDIVNMKIAHLAEAPVLLVVDIDKGGAFAWIVGTLALLTQKERKSVKGIIINKFRGDKDLLTSGIEFIEKKTNLPVLGIIPYFKDIYIKEEDSVPQEKMNNTVCNITKIIIAVMYLPHISNFTDFDPLENESDVHLRYIGQGESIGFADAIIIPGSKNTIDDLNYLKKAGYSEAICRYAQDGGMVLGVCGGYQMLGKKIEDPYSMESRQKVIAGLGLLNVNTTLAQQKITSQITALCSFPSDNVREIKGYEIHVGETNREDKTKAFCTIIQRSNKSVELEDGALSEDGQIWGTYIHDLFANHLFRRDFINLLRKKRGLRNLPHNPQVNLMENQREYDKLAIHVRENLDMDAIYKLLN
ncbi:MAG: cobyric acid synthase [bacterium]